MQAAKLFFLCAVLTAGCSMQQTLYQAGQTGAALRLDARYQITNPPRWRLPEGSRLIVRAAHPAPQQWTLAAVQGVGSVFVVAEDRAHRARMQPGYVLEIHWPSVDAGEAAAAGTSRSTAVGLFGFLEMPKLPPSGELLLSLRDPAGTHIHRFALVVRPEIWGNGWSDPAHIEAAFGQVAETLRGG